MTAYQHPTAGTCQVTGKLKFISRKAAKRVISQKGYRDVSAYACTDCGHIHIGGWHGVKDRLTHREMHGHGGADGGVPIETAAGILGVSADLIRRIIAEGAARGDGERIDATDLSRLRECTWRTA